MSNLRIVAALSFILVCAASIVAADLPHLRPFEAVEGHMGTLFRIKLYAPNDEVAQAAFRKAFDRIAQLDEILSDYKPSSELSRLSDSSGGPPVAVGNDLFQVIDASQRLAEQTDGAFDITLAPIIRLWRAARKTGKEPDAASLKREGELCGYRHLKIDSNRHTVRLELKGMRLDVGGIAKGYAADEALVVIRACGISQALVAASGDLVFSDAPPGKRGWTIGIDSFDDAHKPFTKVLELANAAVSTSGDTEQHFDAGAKRFSHIIDPRTRVGLTNPITVTVVASKGIEADSLATAVSVLGQDRGLSFIEDHTDDSAFIVLRDGTPPHVFASRRFARLQAISTAEGDPH